MSLSVIKAQDTNSKSIHAGLQYKRLFSYSSVLQETISNSNDAFGASSVFSNGYGLGMQLRYTLTKFWSLETGLNLINRNYSLAVNRSDTAFSATDNYTLLGYELPLNVMVNVRLADKIYANAATGVNINVFSTEIRQNYELYENLGVRKSMLNAGLNANLGFDYRSTKDGMFYLGVSYHLPFTKIYDLRVTYFDYLRLDQVDLPIQGDYLTLDLRYYFN